MHPACVDESQLLADCQFRRQRRSGPGGQHRNKVETAVIVTHQPTGIQGEASERRSQEENRKQALFRLRLNLALNVREDRDIAGYVPSDRWQSRCHGGKVTVSPKHDDYPALLAEALDILSACSLDARPAAELLACTPSQLIKLLQGEGRAIAEVNRTRRTRGQSPYR